MNVDKLKALLEQYQKDIADEYARKGGEDIGGEHKSDSLSLNHLYWMAKEVRAQLEAREPNWGKVNRWIGWVQAGMYVNGLREVDDMRAEITESLS